MVKASLFVATYEMPKHLELVLTGLSRQSSKDFELWICDDGSGPSTGEVIERFKKSAAFPVGHLRQEHQGFRKCRILNEALRRAQGEIAIFLDGDCVPHPHFIRDHIEQQEPGRYLAGRRVELGPEVSAWLTPERIRKGALDTLAHPRVLWSFARGESEYPNRMLRLTLPWLRKRLGMDRVVDLKGCNYSVARQALVDINGFDEEYEGYGREDTDVEIRLQNLGLKIKSLKGLALQYHVWHPRREFTPRNETTLQHAKDIHRVRCERGLSR